jgi:hypothetical protein
VPPFPKIVELAEVFRSWSFFEVILEKDLELYHHVLEAHQKV